MNILAIDTALEACSVGLSIDGRSTPIARSEIVERRHAERLFALLEAVLDDGGVKISDIERYAVTIGPGSYTGIRVGVAAIRGLALVTKVKAAGYSTLAVHAETARGEAGVNAVLAALPAKGGEVFAELLGPAGEAIAEAAVMTPVAAAALAEQHAAVLAGAGASAVADAAQPGALTVVHQQSAPDIRSLLRLASADQAADGPPRPLYVKPPDAKPSSAAVARR
jgi:tRNA threonylcarbamoyladenosine biosynthesis protein TsaB